MYISLCIKKKKKKKNMNNNIITNEDLTLNGSWLIKL